MIIHPSPPLLIAILGPTASGKSAVAEAVAAKYGLQLVSADAFMVYRGFDIGTNKPTNKEDYELLDIVDPTHEFGVGEWVQRASDVLWSLSPLREDARASRRGAGGGAWSEGSDSPSSCPDDRAGEEEGAGGWRSDSPLHERADRARSRGGAGGGAPEPRDTGLGTRDTGLGTRDSGLGTRDSGLPRGAVVVGGTGFYVRALFEEYSEMKPAPDPAVRERLEDRERAEGLAALAQELAEMAPDLAQATDLKNPVRVRRALERLADPRPPIAISLPPFRKLKFVLDPPQADLDKAITARTAAMLQAGWPEEVRSLLENGLPRTAPAFRAIGYDSVIELLEGRLGEEDAKARIATETRQYAKRQRTWLRAEPNARTATPEEIMDCIDSLGQ